jgi:hypothetical protein
VTLLTDKQARIVRAAAASVPPEKRDVFLQRIAALLVMRGGRRFNDHDVAQAAQLAIAGLVQTPSAA